MDAAPSLSFPAILRNPGLNDRYAHLGIVNERQSTQTVRVKPPKREANEGKRWVRRNDNARFEGNPHIVTATKADYIVEPTQVKPTFPEPLPPYLPRTARLPAAVVPTRDPNSANAGRFSLSLKGMRRDLRKGGFRTESLVRDVEEEILQWLQAGGAVLGPDTTPHFDEDTLGVAIKETGTIFEVSRTPLQLVWFTGDDNFARYVVHCCARYHGVVSFSKDISGRRYTYLLRPNVTRPDHHAPGTLDTPPATDITDHDYSSQPETESDVGGQEVDSDVEPLAPSAAQTALPAISEDISPILSPNLPPQDDDEAWSIINDADSESHESGYDAGLVDSIISLSMASEDDIVGPILDSDRTPRAGLYRRKPVMRRRVWSQGVRGTSSPSRSPARQGFRLNPLRFEKAAPVQRKSFYDYLFS